MVVFLLYLFRRCDAGDVCRREKKLREEPSAGVEGLRGKVVKKKEAPGCTSG
jgi:hypothetical protein